MSLWFSQGSAFLKYFPILHYRQTMIKAAIYLISELLNPQSLMSFYWNSEWISPSVIKCPQLQRGITEFFGCFTKDSSGHDPEFQTLEMRWKFRCHCVYSEMWESLLLVFNLGNIANSPPIIWTYFNCCKSFFVLTWNVPLSNLVNLAEFL